MNIFSWKFNSLFLCFPKILVWDRWFCSKIFEFLFHLKCFLNFQAYLRLCNFVLGVELPSAKTCRLILLEEFERRFGVQATVEPSWPVRPTKSETESLEKNFMKCLESRKLENPPKTAEPIESKKLLKSVGPSCSLENRLKSAFAGKMSKLQDRASMDPKKVLGPFKWLPLPYYWP